MLRRFGYVLLIATFAVAFLLQSVALLIDQRDNTLGEPAASLAPDARAVRTLTELWARALGLIDPRGA